MAEQDVNTLDFDPRAIRYPCSARMTWPDPAIDSPHRELHLGLESGTTAAAGPSTTGRTTSQGQTYPADMQASNQHHRLQPASQGQEQVYRHLKEQQNRLRTQPHISSVQPHQHPHSNPHRQQTQPLTNISTQPRLPAYNIATSSQSQPQHGVGHAFSSQQSRQQQHQCKHQRQHLHPHPALTPQSFAIPMNSPQDVSPDPQSGLSDWPILPPQAATQQPTFPLDDSRIQQFANQQFMQYGSSPVDLLPGTNHFSGGVDALQNAFLSANNSELDNLAFTWQDLSNPLTQFGTTGNMQDGSLGGQVLPNSPTDSSLEVRSLSSSDNGWASVDYTHGFDGSFSNSSQSGAIFNPEQTLHGRTFSDSSYSDAENQARLSWGSYANISQHAIGSPSTESAGDHELINDSSEMSDEHSVKQELSPVPPFSLNVPAPVKAEVSISSNRQATSPRRRTSPPGRRPPRKSSIKAAKVKRQPPISKDAEKKVGRRKGPLRPEQRKQASEIRKMGACLRCKFLKKTCDKQETCEGCKPSHARLWQVPCTRVEIRDIGFFMRDWKADYELQIGLGFSIDNIKGFAKNERILLISHGYGHVLPVRAREVFVRDERCFGMDWVETVQDYPAEHCVDTAKLSAGIAGISQSLLSDYLDAHIKNGYEDFIHRYFGGTPFVTEMLLTVYRYYVKEQTPVIKKALKFLLAYNLTQHVTLVEGIPDEEGFLGRIEDEDSSFYGKTVAPVMINFQVKVALAGIWRELQKDILDELQSLYQSIYSKEKLRHWPTIFMLASVLLAVWEEMQFDCHYRIPDKDAVNKFCEDMESMPVKVIVGLFTAISQKLPSFQEWDTRKHHAALNSNPAICDALTEVRQHVTRHDQYLRGRADSQFDRDDFDSLSSKFMSKLVIRASAS